MNGGQIRLQTLVGKTGHLPGPHDLQVPSAFITRGTRWAQRDADTVRENGSLGAGCKCRSLSLEEMSSLGGLCEERAAFYRLGGVALIFLQFIEI